MKLEILMIGKIKEKPYRELIESYFLRCSGKMCIELIHCKNEDEMEKRLKNRSVIVALDEEGKNLDSTEFSEWLLKLVNRGTNAVVFCLGGAEGLSEKLKQKTSETLSLSKFTLNHQLALLVLAEQIYRGVSIIFGEPYHKQ